MNIKLIVLKQRIRGIFDAAKFFNDRGGEGEERSAVKYLEVGRLMRLSAMRYKKRSSPLSTTLPAIINRLIQTPYNLVKTRNTALMRIYVR